jgi:hypothetical protein
MKQFVVTSSPGGVYISKTQGKRIPKNAIVAEFDSYAEALTFRDELRAQIADSKAVNGERWHERFDAAYSNGDLATLSRLCGI